MNASRTAIALAVASLCAADASAALFSSTHAWTFNHTAGNGSKSMGSEIVAFDAVNQRIWVAGTDANQANVGLGGVDVLDLAGNLVHTIDTSALGGINSVAVSNGRAAFAVTAPVKTNPGLVRFVDAGTFAQLADVTVGANPDSVTYTPDGSRLLVANEGEPSSYLIGPSGDPEGSVSIIDANTFAVQTAGFGAFNTQAAALKAAGVRLNGPNATVAQDLEPEYIAVSADGKTAVATLQEANALAFIDIDTATVTGISPLGLKDHSLPGNGFDASDRDGPGNNPLNGNIQNWNVFGLYMPDGIASFSQGGNQYYITANEGDSRADWPGGNDEFRVSALTIDPALNASLSAAHGADWQTNNDKLSRLNATNTGDTDSDGDQDRIEVFGARSFTIVDANGTKIFDSGDQLEQIIKAQFPELWDDSRSDNKGPEPESAVVGHVGGVDLLFLGLERSNAIMVWDISKLDDITFLDMLRTTGDVGPEGLSFFSTAQGAFLAVASEVSETTTLYRISARVPAPEGTLPLLGAGVLAGLLARTRRRGTR